MIQILTPTERLEMAAGDEMSIVYIVNQSATHPSLYIFSPKQSIDQSMDRWKWGINWKKRLQSIPRILPLKYRIIHLIDWHNNNRFELTVLQILYIFIYISPNSVWYSIYIYYLSINFSYLFYCSYMSLLYLKIFSNW